MDITPITATVPACYGVCCSRKTDCDRYRLIEQTSSFNTISTCSNTGQDTPLFVALKTAAATPQPEVIQ